MTPTLPITWSAAPGIHAATLEAAVQRFSLRDTVLTDDERVLMRPLATTKRRVAFFGGRLLLKQCILTGIPDLGGATEADIDISRGPTGAPVVRIAGKDAPGLQVTISHGGGYLFAGAVSAGRIGVDVEPVGERTIALRDAFLSDSEIAAADFSAEAEGNPAVVYTSLFSAKESLAKWAGTHMYHAFHYWRFSEVRGDILYFKTHAAPGNAAVNRRVFDGHVFTWTASSEKDGD